MYTFVNISPFTEHPILDVAQFDAGEYDVTIFEDGQPSNFLNKGTFFRELYCKCLLHKLFSLPKSKIKPFIQYQCERMKEPVIWLNKFEKLIDVNRELFTKNDHKIRLEKALVIIELMRDSIEKRKSEPTNQFDFIELKNKIREYGYEEKLCCLMEAKTEYLQNKPKLINPTETPFDEKINLELDLLKSRQKISRKKQEPMNNIDVQSPLKRSPQSPHKFKINTNLNQFIDIFFQLMHDKKTDGKPYLEASPNELAEMIAIWFKDKEGKEISIETVKTILKPSRYEKRPKGNARFLIE